VSVTSVTQTLPPPSTVLPAGAQAAVPSASTASMQNIEKNLEKWRQELIKGFRAFMWEGQRVVAAEVTVKLDATGGILQFLPIQQKRSFAFFNSKIDIASVKLTEVLECVPGAEINVENTEKNLMLTVIVREIPTARVVVLKLANRDERNVIMSKLRAVAAASAVLFEKGSSETKQTTSLTQVSTSKATFPSSAAAVKEGSVPTETNPLFAQRLTRRPSVREVVINRNLQGSATISAPESSSKEASGNGARSKVTVDNEGSSAFNPLSVKNLLTELKEEKEANAKVRLQLVAMNGELIERDEQLALMKKLQTDYESQLREKDNLMKQDTMVRLQLGKRLEQVLMDKEDALEQLEQLKAQLDMITRGL
jgi:hypothetical protein